MKDNLIEFEGEIYKKVKLPIFLFILTLVWTFIIFYFWDKLPQLTRYFCIFYLGMNTSKIISKL